MDMWKEIYETVRTVTDLKQLPNKTTFYLIYLEIHMQVTKTDYVCGYVRLGDASISCNDIVTVNTTQKV